MRRALAPRLSGAPAAVPPAAVPAAAVQAAAVQAAALPAAALLAAALLVAGCGLRGDDGAAQARGTGRDFLARWAAGDTAAAAALTTDAAAARSTLDETTSALRVTRWRLEPGRLSEADDAGRRTLTFTATAALASLPEWRYEGSLPLVEREGEWRVAWQPAAVHPRLTPETRLARTRTLPPRAPVVDRDGVQVMTEQPVVDVGVEPQRVAGAAGYARIAALVDVDAAALARRAAAARPDAFLPVITLRRPAYDAVSAQLRSIPGVRLREATRTLAPTPTFGRALLGRVGPATADALAAAGPFASSADLVGLSGLQARYQKQLAGIPGTTISVVERTTRTPIATVHEVAAKPGTPLRTTLDYETQIAAERALASVSKPAALVALQASTGAVLAAANAPADSAFNRAFVGRYAPGSTFKVVTSAALLARGLTPATAVPCPQTATVRGKAFRNVESFALGSAPFSQVFARSCNTAFVTLAQSLPATALREQAAVFGLGASYDVGLPAYTGSVPATPEAVERAAAAIGQGKVLASPLAMAAVAATVQSGAFRAPRLVGATPTTPPASPGSPASLDPTIRAALQALMRGVVTGGSASVLASLPAPPAFAKTGTAEYGSATPPRTHAWTIGFRGDVAFAVLVEDGGLGGEVAAPLARAFLAGLA